MVIHQLSIDFKAAFVSSIVSNILKAATPEFGVPAKLIQLYKLTLDFTFD